MTPLEALRKIAADTTADPAIRAIAEKGLRGVVFVDRPPAPAIDIANVTPQSLIDYWKKHGRIPAE